MNQLIQWLDGQIECCNFNKAVFLDFLPWQLARVCANQIWAHLLKTDESKVLFN